MNKLDITTHPKAKNFLGSIATELNILQPQFYFPGFDVISDDDIIYTPESILDSKYKVLNVDYKIDRVIEKAAANIYADISEDESSESSEPSEPSEPSESSEPLVEAKQVTEVEAKQVTEVDAKQVIEVEEKQTEVDKIEKAEDEEWTDCSSESEESNDTLDAMDNESILSEYDLLSNNHLDIPDEEYSKEQLEQTHAIAEQTKFFDQVRKAAKNDNTDNCFSLMATLQKNYKQKLQTYHQVIFCKKAPLIEPLKAINPEVYPDLFTSAKAGTISTILLPDPNSKQVFNKLNSIHNTSHVETLALYSLSKLTELGRCPTFPYYFGSVQGILPEYYHNITDEIQEHSEYDWFNELLEDDMIEILYIDISAYTNSGREILRSEDMTIDIPDNEMPTAEEVKQFQENIDGVVADFELLLDDTDVDEFIATGKLTGMDEYKPTDDFKKSSISTMGIKFEDLDEIDIDTLKPDDILPERKFENKLFYLKLVNYPVSLSFMEKMIGSLDDSMNSPRPMTEQEMLSVLFQVAFGLAVANKEYKFVHNDLHAGNIMFQSTPQKYLYYSIHGNYYLIPTFHKIVKIIDFARATMYINDKWIVSDAFEPDNDAGEQYAMPNSEGKYSESSFDENGNKLPHPNPSFDLALLSTILTHYVSNNIPNAPELNNMLNSWATDKYGINHVHSSVDFSLYLNLARDCHNAVPKEVLKNSIFQKFKVSRKQIPKKQYIYKF